MKLLTIVRWTVVGGVAIATVIGGEIVANHTARQAALTWYDDRGYDPSRDIQFSPGGLQQYTREAAIAGASAGMLPRGAVWILGAAILGIVTAPKTEKWSEQQFDRWLAAVRDNDSLAIAQIETEVRDVVGVGNGQG